MEDDSEINTVEAKKGRVMIKANKHHSFSEKSFWKKFGTSLLTGSKKLVESVLTLYYCLKDKETPVWAKGTIASALGYFILPTDALPDFVPGVGYSDDVGVIALAMVTVATHITAEHRKRAYETAAKLFRLFGLDYEVPNKEEA